MRLCFWLKSFRSVLFFLIFFESGSLALDKQKANISNGTPTEFKLHILHVNDTHSHIEPLLVPLILNGKKIYTSIGGYAKISTYLKEQRFRDPSLLFLHAGDMVQGTLYYNLFGAKLDVDAFNAMNLDCMTLGNHAFDRGVKNLQNDFLSKVTFFVIDANIKIRNQHNKLIPYIIKSIAGQKVALIGVTIDSSKISSPGASVQFANVIETVQKQVHQLELQGIDKIILITHIGYENDIFLASQIQGIDLIIGGHSHTLLGDFTNVGLISKGTYPTIVKHDDTQTLIVTAYKWGEVIGDITLFFDKSGKIRRYIAKPVILLDDIFLKKNKAGKKVGVDQKEAAEIKDFIAHQNNLYIAKKDPAITKIVKTFKPKIDKLMYHTIGKAVENLIHVRLPDQKDQDGRIMRSGSEVVPLVAQAIYEKLSKNGEYCDFVFLNSGSVRSSIFKGDITIGEIKQMLPFGNTVVSFHMRGEALKEMFEDAIERSLIKKTNSGSFIYLWNAKISIDKTKAKKMRIKFFKIRQNGKWVDFDNNKIYKVATNSYIANGGGHFTQMQVNAKEKYDTGFVISDLFIAYVKNVGSLPQKGYK